VDGSVPDALGVLWLPRTAGAGGPDCAADGEGVVVVMDDGDGVVADVDELAAAVGGALCATVGEGLAATREAPGLV